MTPQALDNPIYKCVILQLSRVETYLEFWKSHCETKKPELEWLVMDLCAGKAPDQFTNQLQHSLTSKQVVMEALTAINADVARAKMQGLYLQRLAYEALALGLLQYLLQRGMEVPKEVVSSYKNSLNAAAEALTGEAFHVFE